MFKKRLEEYRLKLKIETKREMAKKLEIREQLYAMVERGARKPSRDVIEKLVAMSKMPEEYWLYGVTKVDYINEKDDFLNLRKTLNNILEHNIIKNSNEIIDKNACPVDNLGKLIIEALKKDIDNLLDL